MKKIILHIDFDSFFASVEQQYHPEFRNRPLGVTASNGRTAIIAASREAKQYGVKGRDRTYVAFQKCPWMLLAKAHFTTYFEVSKKFLAIATKFSPTVELFSMDEVFMDVTDTAKLFGGVDPLVRIIKNTIAKEIGEYITVSVGIAYNKLLAKLASGMNKPNGVCTITEDNLLTIYKKAALTDICGIGFRTAAHLQRIGVHTLLQLRDTPLPTLIEEFGNVEGRFLHEVGLGIDTSDVISYTKAPEVKSVSRNYCLPHNEYNRRVVYQNVFELCEEVGIKLRRLGKTARSVGLGIRGSSNFYKHQTVSEYLETGGALFSLCKRFLDTEFSDNAYARMISVWAGNLQDTASTPLSLFDRPEKKHALQQAIDDINDRFGDHTIRNGFLLYSDKLTTVPNGWMADTYERTKLAEETI